MANVYTTSEVARHNNEKDLWMVIHGHVYDLTKFVTEHPGGDEVLINLAGKDGTVCFDEIGHSEEAVLLRETFKIGTILGDDKEIAPSSAPSQVVAEPMVDDDDWEYQEIKPESSKALPVVLAAGVLVYAVLFYYFWL